MVKKNYNKFNKKQFKFKKSKNNNYFNKHNYYNNKKKKKPEKPKTTDYLYFNKKKKKGIFLKKPSFKNIKYPFFFNLKLINESLKKK